jgi:hypothetical protein
MTHQDNLSGATLFLYIYAPVVPSSFDYFTLDELEDAEETEEEEIPKIIEVKKSEPAPIDATPNTRLNYLHIGTYTETLCNTWKN